MTTHGSVGELMVKESENKPLTLTTPGTWCARQWMMKTFQLLPTLCHGWGNMCLSAG